MPFYDYRCASAHVDEQFFTMDSAPDTVKCPVCYKEARKSIATNQSSFVRGATLNEKSRQQFRHAFGKKKFDKIKTSADVDACFSDFNRRYPHLGGVGTHRKDPHPSTEITDGPDTHPEKFTG